MSRVSLESSVIDPWSLLQDYQREQLGGRADLGATATFIGSMRDFNEGDDVVAMTLEHYPGMTEASLQGIIDEANAKWPLLDCLIVHRVGDINPGEAIMLVAVWSTHRREAFEACRYLVEELKHRAPFWKQETLSSGEKRWVDRNTPG